MTVIHCTNKYFNTEHSHFHSFMCVDFFINFDLKHYVLCNFYVSDFVTHLYTHVNDLTTCFLLISPGIYKILKSLL